MESEDATPATLPAEWPQDDVIQPFRLEPGDLDTGLQGRLVRLGSAADEILTRHDYPPLVAELLGECLALTVTLASALKYDGIFILQVQSDGPVSLVVADTTSDGDLRGYAKYDAEGVAAWQRDTGARGAHVRGLLGEGRLAFTVDQGLNTERYQGMVALTGDTLTSCAQHYFRQSAQLDTGLMLASQRIASSAGSGWRAGGLVLQRLASPATSEVLRSDDPDDPWRRAMMLMATGTAEELLDADLTAPSYLYRLFHEEGLTVNTPRQLRARCRCSTDRIVTVLKSIPQTELVDLAIDGEVKVTCEFCSRVYGFAPSELADG